jgi:hypothetical protein
LHVLSWRGKVLSRRGVGSIKKLGEGAVSRGTFRMKRAHKKIFQEMLATGDGRKYKCNHKGHLRNVGDGWGVGEKEK